MKLIVLCNSYPLSIIFNPLNIKLIRYLSNTN